MQTEELITKRYFQERPLGRKTGNYALTVWDSQKLLVELFGEEERQENMEILESSNFGNGVLFKLRAPQRIYEVLKNRNELKES